MNLKREIGSQKVAMSSEKKKRKSLAIFLSLSIDQILNEGSTIGFEDFILEKRFPFADNCDEILVVIPNKVGRKINSSNTRFRFLSLFELIQFSRLDLRLLILTLFEVIRNPRYKTSYREFSKRKAVRGIISDLLITTSIVSIEQKKFDIKFLVGTNSFLSSGLPTVFSLNTLKSTRIIIWYSINSIPIVKRGEQPRNYLHEDFVYKVDEHFVWDKYQKADLESRGVARATVKKSMVFIAKDSSPENIPRIPSFKVTFFDVTPFKEYDDGFYSTRAAIRTLEELIRNLVLLEQEELEDLELYLKPKRPYVPAHSKSYLQFVEESVSSGKIKWLTPNANIYDVIEQSRVVLTPPFSSPAIIARELGVPCAFYFLPESNWLLPKSHHGIEVLTEVQSLHKFLLSAKKKS